MQLMIRLNRSCVALTLGGALFLGNGCRTPQQYRQQADDAAYAIVRQTQQSALGKAETFTIERPSDVFRRRLMIDQRLPYASQASLGVDHLSPVDHWPDPNYGQTSVADSALGLMIDPNQSLHISLTQALELGAKNSFEYQQQKEAVFQAALALDLEQNAFRNIFFGQLTSQVYSDTTTDRASSGSTESGSTSVNRTLTNGASITGALAVDLAHLWTSGASQTLGLAADSSISIPLLRGAGRNIVTEPLTQAQRDVVYAIYSFERYKRSFAVSIASSYFSVLSRWDAVVNAEQSYRSNISSARRSRRLSDAGRLSSIQLDQAVQSELSARDRWISAQESYKETLDRFKKLLSLPPDARVELERSELERMRQPVEARFNHLSTEDETVQGTVPPADAKIVLEPPNQAEAGPLEIGENKAVELAFAHRLDLRVAQGRVVDAQRKVVVAADQLRGELTLLGRTRFPANDSDALSLRHADVSTLLTLDLPLERTAERNAYRNRLIRLDQAVRDLQSLEDDIKLSLRSQLRTLVESRESLKIQAQAVDVAEKRVASSSMLFEAGRAEIRDLLEAQDDLLSAQNALTRALVNYRLAELDLQRDLGVLNVDENGLWQEYVPKESERVKS